MGVFFCKPAVAKPEESKLPVTKIEPYDYYRCSLLRYMGFASVLAGKMVPPNFAQIPNMAATAFIFSDVFSKTLQSVENEDDPHRTVVTAVDAILWHSMASVLAPLLLYGGLKTATRLAFVRPPKPPKCPPPAPIKKAKLKAKPKPKPALADKCATPPLPPPKCPQPNPPPSNCPPPPPTCPPPSPPTCPPPSPPTCPPMNCCQPPPQVRCQQCKQKEFPTPGFLRIFPGIIALALMPFILKPIQNGVDELLDATYRKWTKEYLKRTELTPEEKEERNRIRKLREEACAKANAEKRKIEEKKKAEQEKEAAKIAAEKAKIQAKEEELAKARRLKEEKEAKELAKKKCLEEEKQRKEQLLAEQQAIKEKLKQEEAELKERKARIEKELKEKAEKKRDCD